MHMVPLNQGNDTECHKEVLHTVFLSHPHTLELWRNLPYEWHHLLHYVLTEGDDHKQFLEKKYKTEITKN